MDGGLRGAVLPNEVILRLAGHRFLLVSAARISRGALVPTVLRQPYILVAIGGRPQQEAEYWQRLHMGEVDAGLAGRIRA